MKTTDEQLRSDDLWPWPAFVLLAGVIALFEFVTPDCRCWYYQVTRIEKKFVYVTLGLLAIRHIIAAIRKERSKDWIHYLILTLVSPFLIHEIVVIGAGRH
jgi:hypothetical protein